MTSIPYSKLKGEWHGQTERRRHRSVVGTRRTTLLESEEEQTLGCVAATRRSTTHSMTHMHTYMHTYTRTLIDSYVHPPGHWAPDGGYATIPSRVGRLLSTTRRNRGKIRRLYDWGSEWMGEWMHGWMNEWMDEWMNEWMIEWVTDWLNEWVNEWMNDWMNEWMNE